MAINAKAGDNKTKAPTLRAKRTSRYPLVLPNEITVKNRIQGNFKLVHIDATGGIALRGK